MGGVCSKSKGWSGFAFVFVSISLDVAGTASTIQREFEGFGPSKEPQNGSSVTGSSLLKGSVTSGFVKL